MIKAKKKIAEEHMQKAVEAAIKTAESASSNGKNFCISLIDVGADTSAMREAVVKVMEKKVFNTSLVISTYVCNYSCFESLNLHLFWWTNREWQLWSLAETIK